MGNLEVLLTYAYTKLDPPSAGPHLAWLQSRWPGDCGRPDFARQYRQYLIQLRVSGVVMVDVNFLVATILVVVALLFYILHWNRVLAFLIGLAFRVVLWNKGGSSAWIQIGAQPIPYCPSHPL